jgi:polysaccharide export outer membrane protein
MKGVLMAKRFIFFTIFLLILNYTGLINGANANDTDQITRKSTFYIGPEDQLEISVWQDEALTKQVVVRPDGKISFPLIGDAQAEGYTVEEFQHEITKKIREYVPTASVAVIVTAVSSPKVFVVGKITTPGVYIMGRPMRVMQLLALAGGLSEFADRDKILIIRNENNKQRVLNFDYGRVSKGKDVEQNILLEPGDTIIVP